MNRRNRELLVYQSDTWLQAVRGGSQGREMGQVGQGQVPRCYMTLHVDTVALRTGTAAQMIQGAIALAA